MNFLKALALAPIIIVSALLSALFVAVIQINSVIETGDVKE